jgi:hypothetical protein
MGAGYAEMVFGWTYNVCYISFLWITTDTRWDCSLGWRWSHKHVLYQDLEIHVVCLLCPIYHSAQPTKYNLKQYTCCISFICVHHAICFKCEQPYTSDATQQKAMNGRYP